MRHKGKSGNPPVGVSLLLRGVDVGGRGDQSLPHCKSWPYQLKSGDVGLRGSLLSVGYQLLLATSVPLLFSSWSRPFTPCLPYLGKKA